jgi:hypothetical protein
MVTVGYSERRRGQIFYLYRDNDTLSFERMVTADKTLTFGWQFRPVLGRKSVSPGMRQMFAVVSVPHSDDSEARETRTLKVAVKTYWRKYYASTLTTADRADIGPWPYMKKVFTLGLAEAVPNGTTAARSPGNGGDAVHVPPTAKYQSDLVPKIRDVRWTRLDDKTALISVEGENFFSGTNVAMGGTAAVAGVVIKSTQAMDIVTPIENVGAGTAMVIGRYGIAQPLIAPGDSCVPQLAANTSLSMPFGGQRELRLLLTCSPDKLRFPDGQLVVFSNGKPVPGVPEISPVRDNKDQSQVTAQIPIELFPKSEGTIALVRPYRNPFRIVLPWYDNAYEVRRLAASGKTIVYMQRKDGVSLGSSAFGSAPKERWKIEFAGKEIKPTFPSDAVMRYEMDADVEGTFMLFEPRLEGGSTLYPLDLPAAKPKPKAPVEPAGGAALVVNQNDAPKLEFTGESIEQVAAVRVEGRDPFKTEYDPGKRILTAYVPQDATKLPAKLTLQFRDASGKLIASQALEIKALPDSKPAVERAKKP